MVRNLPGHNNNKDGHMIKAQHSVLSPEALLTVIKRHYPSIGAHDCKILALNCNDNFFIKGKRQDYVFRLNRKDWWPREDFDEELRFLEFLKRRKISAVVPKRNKQNKRYISMKTAEGTRYGALFGYLDGQHVTFSPGKRNINMLRLGELAAQLHDAADQLRPPVQRWTMDFDFLVTETLEGLTTKLAGRDKDLAYLHRLADHLQGLLDDTPADALDFGYCHGDLHTGNVWLSPDDELTLIDFDWSGYCWRIYDLATLWWTMRSDEAAPRWRAVMRGYTRLRKLSRHEKALLPAFVMIREFELLGFHLMMRKHMGDAWLDDHYYNHHMKFIRGWVKQHLGNLK
jgi:Ser/Thr protein kinase RdoA (MazF antagonist)